jgi:outer membrane protein OmpA-like peptidoglycan-associated protein
MMRGVIFPLLLCGCTGTGVALFPGENGAGTGAVVVLDPETGADVAVLDQANSRTGVRNRSASVRAVPPEKLDARYGALLAALPEPPRLFRLYFDAGTTDLVDQSQAELGTLLAEVKRRPGADVQIVGHTDTTGSDTLNDELSVKRAGEVKALFAGLGIDADIIRATGRGERELYEPTPDETPSELNRRVEVYVK